MDITNKSTWIEKDTLESKYPELESNLSTDVVIVGAGITGVFSAYLLAKAGKKVILIDKGVIGSGETAYTTAFLTHVIDEDLQKLVKTFGKEKSRLIWKAAGSAIDMIENIVSEEKIRCEFERCSAYFFTTNKKDVDYLKKEVELATELGFRAEFVENDNSIGFNNLGYARFDNQAKFQPREFLLQLAEKAKQYGAKIFENTSIQEYCCKNPTKVKTSKFEVSADFAIVSTHVPNSGVQEVITRMTPKQSYVMEVWTNEDIKSPKSIYCDTNEPYNYFRIDQIENLTRIILGGEDHETGKDSEDKAELRFQNLQDYLSKLYPGINFEITNRWSGQILESIDGIPFIGASPSNEYQLVGTGFNGDGMVFGPLSAMINADFILKKENEFAELFSVNRFKNTVGLIQRGAEFVEGAVLKKFLLPSDKEVRNIVLDSGKVVKINGKPVAVYKNQNGELKKISAICTHQGCIVKWNQSQKSWDCPCHGSRFSIEGEIINGPAKKPLEEIE